MQDHFSAADWASPPYQDRVLTARLMNSGQADGRGSGVALWAMPRQVDADGIRLGELV
ncbi:hypothetical protein [Pelagicoccus enzymogenes]|uniref:hypothetical protein n=1 Tax=Pelagicoccus enzymogenes TaxID=2773457 RepID=UPI002810CF93|nr:hypothetical protein [Pelagicoccus enzymogenes]